MVFLLFLLQLVHSHTQISCKIHSRFSVHSRLVRDRPRVRSSHKASLLKTKVQSYCHLAIMHGSGAGSLKVQICGGAIVASLHKDGTSRCRLAQGPERPGQAANVRWTADCQDSRCSFRIHTSLISAVSHTLMQNGIRPPWQP